MLRKSLLLGLSTAAVTVVLASPAAAQNTQTNCGGTTNNVCTVTQTAAQSNSSTINITSGTGNNVTVNQTGTAETSIVQITGNTNTVNHQQAGVLDVANTTIAGNNNGSAITQAANGAFNTATVSLLGNNNSSSILQGAGANGGSRNTASVTAQGNSLRGSIDQQAGTSATDNGTAIINLGSTAAVSGATLVQNVSIFQRQAGNSATVFVRGGNTVTTAGAEGQNSATVIQQNQLFINGGGGTLVEGVPSNTNNPATQNVVDISISGQANGVSANQNGVQNNANVSVNRGIAANATAVTNANFAPGRSGRNSATVTQNGQGNRALVSIGGRDSAGQQGLGNNLTITQGTSVFANRGTSHSATVFQFGQLSQITVNQQDNTATVGSTARQGASTADISQSSFYSTVSLEQSGGNDAIISQGGGTSVNNSILIGQTDLGSIAAGVGGGGAFPPTTPGAAARNSVNVSQAGGSLGAANAGNELNINQSGVLQSATVFQRGGSALNDTFIAQGTAGALAGGQATPAFFTAAVGAAVNNTGLNQQLTVNVDQGGASGVVQVRQDGANQSATISQNASNTAASGAFVGQNGAVALISQVGLNQSATVNQTGSNSTATVDQRNGSAAGGSNTQTSVVQISQVGGGSGINPAVGGTVNQNIAIARQINTATGTSVAGATGTGATGPSGDVDARAAGGYGNRIEISQTNQSTGTTAGTNGNSGNLYAEAEQRGVGQLARITQTGSNNTAAIFQDTGATNAIAIINQSGRNNTFFVTQTAANQFLRAVQTGNNNQTVTASGAGGGGTFTNTFAPGAPFTPTP